MLRGMLIADKSNLMADITTSLLGTVECRVCSTRVIDHTLHIGLLYLGFRLQRMT